MDKIQLLTCQYGSYIEWVLMNFSCRRQSILLVLIPGILIKISGPADHFVEI